MSAFVAGETFFEAISRYVQKRALLHAHKRLCWKTFSFTPLECSLRSPELGEVLISVGENLEKATKELKGEIVH